MTIRVVKGLDPLGGESAVVRFLKVPNSGADKVTRVRRASLKAQLNVPII